MEFKPRPMASLAGEEKRMSPTHEMDTDFGLVRDKTECIIEYRVERQKAGGEE